MLWSETAVHLKPAAHGFQGMVCMMCVHIKICCNCLRSYLAKLPQELDKGALAEGVGKAGVKGQSGVFLRKNCNPAFLQHTYMYKQESVEWSLYDSLYNDLLNIHINFFSSQNASLFINRSSS